MANLVEGLAVPYGEISTVIDRSGRRYLERIEPGAFRKAIERRLQEGSKGQGIKMLVKHKGWPLASTKGGTLLVKDTPEGVRIRADLDPDNPDSKRVLSAAKRGDARSMSVGMKVLSEGKEWKDGRQVRVIKEADLAEVSAVEAPVYKGTSLNVTQLVEGASAAKLKLAAAKEKELTLTASA